MNPKIAFAVVTLASLFGSSVVQSQQPPAAGYAPSPQVSSGFYGTVVPVQYAPVVSASGNPFVDDGQAIPQPTPAPAPAAPALQPTPVPAPPTTVMGQGAPVVSPLPIGAEAPDAMATGIASEAGCAMAGCDSPGCDSTGLCSQCGMHGDACGCDSAWSGYCGFPVHLGLWERLRGWGHSGLLSNAWCRLQSCGLCQGGLCQGGLCQGAGQGLFGLCHRGYPRPSFLWAEGEYLLWWNKNRSLPILATTSIAGTPYDEAGVLGEPGTSVLAGGGKYDNSAESGYRVGLGVWLNPQQTWGIGGRYMHLGSDDARFDQSSYGNPILARPFYNAALDQEDALVVAYPGISSGRIRALSSNEITGYEAYFRKMLYFGYCNRVDLIFGYQRTEISDTMRVGSRVVSETTEGLIPLGTVVESEDRFRAQNDFDGGEIGLMAQGFDGRISWNLMTKLGLGNTRQKMTISGQTVTTVPGFGSATSNQGLLALDSNSGVYEDDQFTLVPELSLSMGYSLTNLVQLSVGYTLMYWDHVVLSGGAPSDTINPTQINGPVIGPAVPTYTLEDESFWVQALTCGVNIRF